MRTSFTMAAHTAGTSSDYYDITAEEEALLCQLDAQGPVKTNISPSVTTSTSHASRTSPATLRRNEPLARFPAGVDARFGGAKPGARGAETDSVVYPDLSRALSSLESDSTKTKETIDSDLFKDTRPPLARFRTFPRKPFSVTDLTSGGAWCELQYFYTLTRLPGGRKTRTASMKQGSKVHKQLEDQVYTTVRIEVETKEDVFGLKMWNVIQGLRTLRETGLTRELEVWGMVDGHLVTGIIDGLSDKSPDPEFEAELAERDRTEAEEKAKAKRAGGELVPQLLGRVEVPGPKIYLCDVKTRGTPKPPTSPALLRPAKIQLFLYHRFLSEIVSDKVDFFRVFRRLNLDPDEPFTDQFLAQIGSLHDEVFLDAQSSSEGDTNPPTSSEGSTQETTPDLVQYRTLRELLLHMIEELHQTFPFGADSLGRLLSVDYRFRGDGSIIGNNVFPMDDRALDLHLASDMQWWRGDREPRGVDVEEAFKCRICEFAEDCKWRRGLDLENLKRAKDKLGVSGI